RFRSRRCWPWRFESAKPGSSTTRFSNHRGIRGGRYPEENENQRAGNSPEVLSGRAVVFPTGSDYLMVSGLGDRPHGRVAGRAAGSTASQLLLAISDSRVRRGFYHP